MIEIYGFPAPMPYGIDFVTYSNEDLGYTDAFAAGTDVFSLPIPYPSSMNLWEETMIVFCIEFILHTNPFPVTSVTSIGGLIVHLSMLDDRFTANWGGALADTEDEAFKAQFAGPMYVGSRHFINIGTVITQPSERSLDGNITAQYYPPEPLDLVTPLYMQITNAFSNIALATAVVTQDDDADPSEFFALRVWFIKRGYSAQEKAWLNRLPTRFQQLDS